MDAVLKPPQDQFPIGTNVGAYPQTAWPTGRSPSAAPNGAALETKAVAAGGTLTFTTLSAGAYYAAFDSGGGVWRRIAFNLGAVADVPGDQLDPAQFPDGSIPTAKLSADNGISAAMLAPSSVGASELTDGTVAAIELAANAATQAELDAVDASRLAGDVSIVANRKLLLQTAGRFSASGLAATKYFLIPGVSDQSAPAPNIGSLGASFIRRILSADFPAIAGKTAKLRLWAMLLTVIAPTQSYKVGLYPVVAGATITLGTLVTGSDSGLTFNAPAANSILFAQGADFALPADGNYAPGYEITGGAPAQAATFQVGLEVVWN